MTENFSKDKSAKDGLCPQCIDCRKDFYLKKLYEIKIYNEQNRVSRNTYLKNKRESDVKFRLNSNTRSRLHHALNGKSKSSSTRDIFGIDIDTYRKLIEWQMTPEMNWSNIEIDHVIAICLFVVSNHEQLKEAFNWKNTQPFLKHGHQQKGIKFNFLDYQLQFIKAYQFINLIDQEGPN